MTRDVRLLLHKQTMHPYRGEGVNPPQNIPLHHCSWLLSLLRAQVIAHCILSPSPTPPYQCHHQDHHRHCAQQSQLWHQSPQPHPAWWHCLSHPLPLSYHHLLYLENGRKGNMWLIWAASLQRSINCKACHWRSVLRQSSRSPSYLQCTMTNSNAGQKQQNSNAVPPWLLVAG